MTVPLGRDWDPRWDPEAWTYDPGTDTIALDAELLAHIIKANFRAEARIAAALAVADDGLLTRSERVAAMRRALTEPTP